MRLLELANVLRSAGLVVHEYPGWRERGADTSSNPFGPVVGIICHGTGGSLTSTDAGEINVIAITGSATAPEVPIAQLYQSRSGEWTVIASGRATGVKTGTAGPMKGLSDDSVLQIEAQHNGAEPWTPVQYWSYVRGVAALVRYLNISVSMVAGHYEHQPTEKTDPWFSMNQFRADVARLMAQRKGKRMFLAYDPEEDQHWLCDGMGRRKVRKEDIDDIKYLGKVGAINLWLGTTPHEAPNSIWNNVSPAMGDPIGTVTVNLDEAQIAEHLVEPVADAVAEKEAAADRARADALEAQ
jgi:hypothetical protein